VGAASPRARGQHDDGIVLVDHAKRELLDTQRWATQDGLASAIFEWIEAGYNPRRRHTSLGMLAPHEFETLHTAAEIAA
jgi:putative transposase